MSAQGPITAAELAYYDVNAPLLGFMGAAFALVFSNIGAAYGTGKSGQALSATGVSRPDLTFKNIIPVTLGNAVGGAFFVALLYKKVYGKA